MYRRAFLASSAGLVAVLSGCTAQGGDSSDYDIGMSTDAFRPATLTVEVGETVSWKNTSKQGHTVTAYGSDLPEEADYFASGGYGSQSAAQQAWIDETGGRLAQGDSYEHTFEVPGDHRYFCIPHERVGMAGVVTVE